MNRLIPFYLKVRLISRSFKTLQFKPISTLVNNAFGRNLFFFFLYHSFFLLRKHCAFSRLDIVCLFHHSPVVALSPCICLHARSPGNRTAPTILETRYIHKYIDNIYHYARCLCGIYIWSDAWPCMADINMSRVEKSESEAKTSHCSCMGMSSSQVPICKTYQYFFANSCNHWIESTFSIC